MCVVVLSFSLPFLSRKLICPPTPQVTQATKVLAVTSVESEANETANATDSGAPDEDPEEWISLPDSISYYETILRFVAILHTLFSFSMLVAYCCLKVSAACDLNERSPMIP